METPNAKTGPITLKLNKEFKRAYYRGGYRANPILVTYLVRTHLKQVRYGITTGKKIGKAVERNRARRLIRVAFAEICKDYEWNNTNELPGYDFVFVAREKTPFVKSDAVYHAMSGQIRALLQNPERKK